MEENDIEQENIVKSEDNQIKISNDTIATYAGIAIAEVQGVCGMSGTLAGITEVISGKKNFAKGIKVDVEEGKVKVDVNIIVEYGVRIPDVAFEIQSRVKKSLETMTGLKVSEVNVNVQGVKAMNEEEKISETKYIVEEEKSE